MGMEIFYMDLEKIILVDFIFVQYYFTFFVRCLLTTLFRPHLLFSLMKKVTKNKDYRKKAEVLNGCLK